MTAVSVGEQFLLNVRTVRHLRASQVVHRIRLRTQRAAMGRAPEVTARLLRGTRPARGSWPGAFRPLDSREERPHPDAASNARGLFEFVGERHDLGADPDWEPRAPSQLWRYHLHYWDWAWTLANHPDRAWARDAFIRLWSSWQNGTVVGRWDAWSPYVVSLRTWSFCGLYADLIAGSDHEEAFLADLRMHANYVRINLEHDVGGNHLLKNVKAMLAVSVFFDDWRNERRAIGLLERELGVQVLPDGGHYERSPSYHCQVLGDLIDIQELLRAAYRRPLMKLDDAITRMRRWLGAMLLPDGEVPLFNDAVPVGPARLRLLGAEMPEDLRLTVLGDSGYIIVRPSPRAHLVLDVGPPCPETLPAHAHADCLSFVLHLDGKPMIVDTGTSTYEAGEVRSYERSTSAHNTVVVDKADQTEVYGAFRAARRANPTLELAHERDDEVVVRASHDGYARLPGAPRHRRTWRATSNELAVHDEILGTGEHTATNILHFAPNVRVRIGPEAATLCVSDSVRITSDGIWHAFAPSLRTSTTISGVHVAGGFGVRTRAPVAFRQETGHLPLRLTSRVTW